MKVTKTIFVGLNPSRAVTKVHTKVPKNSAWHRLCSWIDYLGTGVVSFTNLSDDPEWDFKEIDHDLLLMQVLEYDRVVALGGLVSKTLTALGIDHYTLPHPSPRNRMMNDQNKVNEILKDCKEWLSNQS